MNKRYPHLFLTACMLVTMILALAAVPVRGQDAVKAGKSMKMPPGVFTVLDKSCRPCHSDRGGKMAKAVLNLTKWDSYSRRTQEKKSKAMCKMITKGAMPPEQFVESSPELALTKEQKEMICQWANGHGAKK